jgi:multidrug efflux pump subunit AcrA (membrane-fusion protein)
MKTHETRRTLIRGWLASPTDKRGIEEQVQRIANALFFGLTIFSVAFAYFVLSARAQDHPIELRPIKAGLTNGDMVQIIEGLTLGEKVITKGSLFIDRVSGG